MPGAAAYSAIRVLPEPVGADTSTDSPLSMASMASIWKCVEREPDLAAEPLPQPLPRFSGVPGGPEGTPRAHRRMIFPMTMDSS